MRPLFHPCRRYGDPTVYVETLFEKRSLLFDVGEIASLAPRRIRRRRAREIGASLRPSGFAERVFHKLQAYRWNLVESYPRDLVFVVSEVETTNSISTTRLRLRKAFAAEPSVSRKIFAGAPGDRPKCSRPEKEPPGLITCRTLSRLIVE